MSAHFHDGVDTLDWPFVGDRKLVAVFVQVADHAASLHPAERELVAKAGSVRRRTFASGRRAARLALGELGIENSPVLSLARAPVWPQGVVGSITHSASLAAAVVGRAAHWAGVGVDLVRRSRLSARVAKRVLGAAERDALPDAEWGTALFSAKESVYKAVNPLCGEFLAFQDVRITIAADASAFTAATTRPCPSAPVAAAGEGRFFRYSGHWLTVFVVAARPGAFPPQTPRPSQEF